MLEVPEWVLLWWAYHIIFILPYTVFREKRVCKQTFEIDFISLLFTMYILQCKKKRKALKLCHYSHETVANGDNQPVKQSKTPELTNPVKCLDVSIIQKDHSYIYYTSDSPRSIKRKLTNACDKLRSMKYTQQKSRRLQKRVDSLETFVKSLQDSKHSCGFVIGFSSKIAILFFFLNTFSCLSCFWITFDLFSGISSKLTCECILCHNSNETLA